MYNVKDKHGTDKLQFLNHSRMTGDTLDEQSYEQHQPDETGSSLAPRHRFIVMLRLRLFGWRLLFLLFLLFLLTTLLDLITFIFIFLFIVFIAIRNDRLAFLPFARRSRRVFGGLAGFQFHLLVFRGFVVRLI
ncbi:hypothetical protein C8J55DRAFT_213249 [Lentinula edodes]|uniref:Uncharacterized protein n=1 Tax=Lentinula lateritia TaxID=40482 RepID=A0A9W9AXG2_9AGAR|nr:hypothetical protein C8J55DRAFT_213249 [Lentinula edodes]